MLLESCLIFLCRPGFEQELKEEVLWILSSFDSGDYNADLYKLEAKTQSGYIVLLLSLVDGKGIEQEFLKGVFDVKKLIFARQILWNAAVLDLSEENRAGQVAECVASLYEQSQKDALYNELYLEPLDHSSDKNLGSFCKKFQQPLLNKFKKHSIKKVFKKNDFDHLTILFATYQTVLIGFCDPDYSAPSAQGILRLKFPKDAPSRSTLKLEEAFHFFLTAKQENDRSGSGKNKEENNFFTEGAAAVDLGASPGGWSYQLVQRKLMVKAVDRGAMDARLMNSGFVEHLQEDGFKYLPRKKVQWLVCDMVEKPEQVASVLIHWMKKDLFQFAMFNFKLPMKKRFKELQKIMKRIETEGCSKHGYSIAVKHLYHDREEVTLFAHK